MFWGPFNHRLDIPLGPRQLGYHQAQSCTTGVMPRPVLFQGALRAVPFAGVDYSWKHFSVAAQAEFASLPIFAARVGARF